MMIKSTVNIQLCRKSIMSVYHWFAITNGFNLLLTALFTQC